MVLSNTYKSNSLLLLFLMRSYREVVSLVREKAHHFFFFFWRKCSPCQRNDQMTTGFFRLRTEGWGLSLPSASYWQLLVIRSLSVCSVIRQQLQEYVKQHLQAWKTHNMGLSSQSLICSSLWAQHVLMKHRKPHLYG